MSNHNKIRPVDKNNLNGKYKILFSTPQTKNSNIPMEFRGLQIYNSKFLAEEALRKRKKLTKILEEKRIAKEQAKMTKEFENIDKEFDKTAAQGWKLISAKDKSEIIEDQSANPSHYDPYHPLANEEGYVFGSNVDVMTEMVDIQAAARSFESSVEASNTAKRLMMRTIEMLQK